MRLKKPGKVVTMEQFGTSPTYPPAGQWDEVIMSGTVTQTGMERRRFRRAELDMAVAIRSDAPASQSPITGRVKDVSLAGVYAYVKSPCSLKPGVSVFCEVSVPPEQTRIFPFTRIMSKGWVVRVEPAPVGRRGGELPPGEKRLGVAVAFTRDVKAFGTV